MVAQSLAFVGLGVRAVAAGMLGDERPRGGERWCRIIRQAHERRRRASARRFSGEMIDVETVEAMLGDVSIRWVAVEAASGRAWNRTARGWASRHSVTPGNRSRAFLCVRPTYHGLYVGHRRGRRRLAVAAGARRLCCCVPSCRTSCGGGSAAGLPALVGRAVPARDVRSKLRERTEAVVYGKDIGDAHPPPPPSYDSMDAFIVFWIVRAYTEC